ncbi:hypothetical protein ACFR97_04715 [Haloplanus litoreus]|uniref:Uncharacterized protein n=1 Tax=Haloplanus litoreus TaxID=767515 RepID=A0ABD6A0R3_9EURY
MATGGRVAAWAGYRIDEAVGCRAGRQGQGQHLASDDGRSKAIRCPE